MKLLKEVLAVALALLPIEAMAQDTIKIGSFNRDAVIIVAEDKASSSKKTYGLKPISSLTRRYY